MLLTLSSGAGAATGGAGRIGLRDWLHGINSEVRSSLPVVTGEWRAIELVQRRAAMQPRCRGALRPPLRSADPPHKGEGGTSASS